MENKIYKILDDIIKKNLPEAVLFSGGVDSSAILYSANKYGNDVYAITIGAKENKNSSDIEYSRLVAQAMNIKNHIIYYASDIEIYNAMKKAVMTLKTFSPEWISSATTLYLGVEWAKKNGIKSISSGEGADDLFGSFPFFEKISKLDNLDEVLNQRLLEIKNMSKLICDKEQIKYISYYYNECLREYILSIPINERMKKTSNYKTKYPLRKAYENILPTSCLVRPQTMAFDGSGIYNRIKELCSEVLDNEFIDAKNKYFNFNSKMEYYLFKEYLKNNSYNKSLYNQCPHCLSNMKNHVMCCDVCSSIKINGKELKFNG